MTTIIWGVLFLILVIVEIATLGLTTIWFAAGALIAVILSAVGAPLWLQIVVFTVVSLVLLYFTRPIAMKYFNNGRLKTNSESLIGEVGIVTKPIQNLQEQGSVLVKGMEWSARTAQDGISVNKDAKVKIVKIEGVKVIVEPIGVAVASPEQYKPS